MVKSVYMWWRWQGDARVGPSPLLEINKSPTGHNNRLNDSNNNDQSFKS